MPGSFIDVLNIIATGREFGFSITEKLYQPVEIDGRTWVGLRALRGRDPSTFQFMTDEYGELDYVRQLMAGRIIEFQLDKFVHYVHNPEFDPYLGQSDLREAYRSWYMKDTLIRLWAFYMEKLGGGLTVAQASEQANLTPNSKEHLALQAAFSNMKASSYILLPAGVTAEVHFPQGTDSFKAAIEFHDLAIAKALLVPNLMGVSSTGRTGSYAQSQTQLESFAWTLKADTMRLEACVDEQIVKDLCEQNWGDGDYPHFKFKPLSTQAMMQLITTWAALIQAKAVIPTEDDEDRLREILEMPARDEDAKPLAVIMQEMMPAPEPSPAPTEGDQLTPQAEGIAPPKVAPVEPKAAVGRSFRRPGKPKLRVVAHTPTGEPRTVTREAFTRALARVEFAVIDAKTNRMAYDGVRQAARLAARATRRVLDPETLPTLLKDNVRQDQGCVQGRAHQCVGLRRPAGAARAHPGQAADDFEPRALRGIEAEDRRLHRGERLSDGAELDRWHALDHPAGAARRGQERRAPGGGDGVDLQPADPRRLHDAGSHASRGTAQERHGRYRGGARGCDRDRQCTGVPQHTGAHQQLRGAERGPL